MQVNLLPVHDAALLHSRLDGLPACLSAKDFRSLTVAVLSSGGPASLIHPSSDELRERVRRDEEQEARAAATLVPTRSADVISEAERNIERSSRTFHRQVARDGAAEQFQQQRQAFRQALTDAKDKGSRVASTDSPAKHARSDTKLPAAADSELREATARKATRPTGDNSAGTARGVSATRSAAGQAVDAAPARVLRAAGAGTPVRAGSAARPNALAPGATGGRAVASSRSAARATVLTQAQPGRAAAGGALKAAGNAPGAVAAARGPAKPGALAATKTGGARPAGNAAWDANIERILAASFISQNRTRASAHRRDFGFPPTSLSHPAIRACGLHPPVSWWRRFRSSNRRAAGAKNGQAHRGGRPLS